MGTPEGYALPASMKPRVEVRVDESENATKVGPSGVAASAAKRREGAHRVQDRGVIRHEIIEGPAATAMNGDPCTHSASVATREVATTTPRTFTRISRRRSRVRRRA